jgi:hypothetical protein
VQVIGGCSQLGKPVPINTPEALTLDSPLFEGKISIQVK